MFIVTLQDARTEERYEVDGVGATRLRTWTGNVGSNALVGIR